MSTLPASKSTSSKLSNQPAQLVKSYIHTEPYSSVHSSKPLLVPGPTLPISTILNTTFHEQDYFRKELKWIEQLENILSESKKYLSLVYAYRGCIRAIPTYNSITPNSANDEEGKTEFYRLTEEIVQPEIQKAKEVMNFFDTSMPIIFSILSEVNISFQQTSPTEYFMFTFAKVLDMFLVLDSLKNMKASLTNDFTLIFRRSRTISKNQVGDDLENQKLYLFLANKDVFYSKLKTVLPSYIGIDDFFWELANVMADRFEKGLWCTPNEKFCLLKSIAFSLLLIDPFLTPKTLTQKKWKPDRFLKLLRSNTVVPLYGDLILEMSGILCKTSIYKWDLQPAAFNPDITLLRCEYISLFASISLDIQAIQNAGGKEIADEFCHHVYEKLIKGVTLIATITGAALQMNAYKYANPTHNGVNPSCPEDALNYEQAIRYNYSQVDKLLLLELLSMSKGGAEKLSKSEAILLPLARRYLHDSFSHYQFTVFPELNKSLTKKRKGSYPYILTLVSIVDAVMQPPEAYLAQGLIEWIYKSNSTSGGFMKEKDLKDTQLLDLESYHDLLFWAPIVLNYSKYISLASDISELWYKEFYLELSKQIQFPIETSLPWMLIQQVLASTSVDLTQSLFIPFLIYDDAANSALIELKLQFIYDEIEAEANLAFDLFLSQYSNMVFQHFKCKAASSLLPESYRKQHGKEKSDEFIYRKHEDVLTNFKTIHLLGRCVPFYDIMTHFLNLAVRNSFEAIIARFESSSLHGVMELQCLLQILRITHEDISTYLPIDNFEDMLFEVDERNVGHGRILSHILNEILVFANNHTYYAATDKFLTSPLVVVPTESTRGGMKHSKHEYLYGNKYFTQMFQGKLSAFTSFIGMDHFKAIVDLLGIRISILLEELTDHFKYSFKETLVPYIWALASEFPASTPKITSTTSVSEAFNIYRSRFDSLLSLNELVNVFHEFRLLGNLFACFKYFELAMMNSHALGVHERTHLSDLMKDALIFLKIDTQLGDVLDSVVFNEPKAVLQRFLVTLQPYIQSLSSAMTPDSSPSYEKSKAFYKIFGFLLFAFCHDRLYTHPLTCQMVFGDGFVLVGTLILCCLNQAEVFKALDPTLHLCLLASHQQKAEQQQTKFMTQALLIQDYFQWCCDLFPHWLGKEKYWNRPWEETKVEVSSNEGGVSKVNGTNEAN